MTTGEVIYMLLLCGFLWGGFVVSLVYLAKQGDDGE